VSPGATMLCTLELYWLWCCSRSRTIQLFMRGKSGNRG
jgi:hypothetical protein